MGEALTRTRRDGAILAFLLMLVLRPDAAYSAPSVGSVTAGSETIGLYEKFEASFDVATSAENLFWPYDTSPPASIPVGAGVSVDGLFSNDNWATTIVVPAFYTQDYSRRLANGTGAQFSDEALTPVGQPHWQVRFAPTRIGEWRYKIRVQDASGTTTYPSDGDMSFACVASQSHGFVEVSPTDSRYFELSDGTSLLGPGINAHFHSTYEADSLLQTYGANGVKIARWWINYREWQNPFGGGDGNPQWSFSLTMANTGGAKSGDRYCAVVSPGEDTKQSVYVGTGTLYRLTCYVKTADVVGDAGKGAYVYAGTQKSAPLQGTNDWTKVTLDFSPTADGRISVGCKHSGTAGTAYFDDASLRASGDGGATWSSECLSKGDFDFQNYVELAEAWKVDHIFEIARQKGVYLKTVIAEKQDYTLGCIQPDGATDGRSDSNFYASDSHPSRWLQKAWWRYMTARWGSYTSLHSWELCNEGDPFNGDHWGAASALATYVHSIDPNKALCCTSFWHSVPMDFHKNTSCDYIDVHEYIGPVTSGTASHGPRYYAWYDPNTSATEASLMPIAGATGELSRDTSQHHTGSASHKILALEGGAGVSTCKTESREYHVGIDPTHTYTLRYWAKAANVTNLGGGLSWTKPRVSVTWSKAYHENDYIDSTGADADLGTYEWKQYQSTGIVPPSGANTANIAASCTRGPSGSGDGTFWVDDIEFIDEITGQNLFVDGGFEGDRIDYDTALAIAKYGVLLNSYGGRVGKPGIWGETGIRGPNVYGTPYNGCNYTEENQQLVDDAEGVYLRKMIWAHTGPFSPNMLLWWTDNCVKKGLWGLFRAFQAYMSGIPLSNGHYADAKAVASSSRLRAFGQKDATNRRAHLWIDNALYTWKNVVDGVSVPAASGIVTVPGLPDGQYQVEWWDTSTGVISKTDSVECSGGQIALQVSNLVSDVACKIGPKPGEIEVKLTLSTANPKPGEVVTVTVKYTNIGSQDTYSAAITARIPALMDYIIGSAEASGGIYNSTAKSVTWTIPSVPAAGTGTRTFQARVQ